MVLPNNPLVRLGGLSIMLLLLLGAVVSSVSIKNQITRFFPNDTHNLLQHQLNSSLDNPWLMVLLDDAAEKQLISDSKKLQQALSNLTIIANVENGSINTNQLKNQSHPLFAYRYLLNNIKPQDFSQLFKERWSEWQLGVVPDKRLLLADPIYAWWRYWEKLKPPQTINKVDGVWLLQAEKPKALLMLKLKQPLDAKSAKQLQTTINTSSQSRVTLTGPAWIAWQSRVHIEKIVQQVTLLISVLVGALLLFVFRSGKTLVLIFIPLLFALLGGTLAVQWFFTQVQALTLALGAVLIGIAVDYPIHVAKAGKSPWVWKSLFVGGISTLVGFLSLTFTQVEGLQQLALFSAVGLTMALGVTWLLAPLLSTQKMLYETHKDEKTKATWNKQDTVLSLVLCGGLCLFWFLPKQQNVALFQLGAIPQSLIQADREARNALGVSEIGKYLLVRDSNSLEQLLQGQEKLSIELDTLVANKAIHSYQMLAHWLPSKALQEQRKQQLPDKAILLAGIQSIPLKEKHFAAFLHAIQQTRTLEPIDLATYQTMVAELPVSRYLLQENDATWGIVPLHQVQDEQALQQFAANHAHVEYIDQKQLVSKQLSSLNQRVAQVVLFGLLAVLVVLLALQKNGFAAIKLLLPGLLGIVLTLLVLVITGQALSIFHSVALLLVGALGLDYSVLMQNRPNHLPAKQWLPVIAVAHITTLLSFLVLGFSGLAVLEALGFTVALGIMLSFVLAYWQLGYSVSRLKPGTS